MFTTSLKDMPTLSSVPLYYIQKNEKKIIENDNKYQLDIIRAWLLPLYIFDLYL